SSANQNFPLACRQIQQSNLTILDWAISRSNREEDRPATRKGFWEQMILLTLLRVRPRQNLGLTSGGGNAEQSSSSVFRGKYNIVRSPARSTGESVDFAYGHGGTTVDRNLLKQSGSHFTAEAHPVAVR